MRRAMKFGRKLPMPSLVQIKHDLKMMTATDALVDAMRTSDYTQQELTSFIDGLAENYGISSDRVQKLSQRFGVAQSAVPIPAS